ncbi:LLM class F420-dependent oxidoreductase [Actinomadura sp. SCN-SB]|uniref:LLM class F420-dependent oxidoreductase n=1 Tax=Actinomadura sp. SCN-SB TaxID=3373092 RepID=UPI0037511FB0
MKFGVLTLGSGSTIDVAGLGRAVEERGFESLFVPEHTHVPVDVQTPFPTGMKVLPEAMQGLDQFVMLSALAASTSRLLLGTGICEVPLRDPIILAKTVASVDVVSGGRFLFGAGGGWMHEEMLNHGVEPRTRMARMTEYLRAMKQIWIEHEASFAGEFLKFDPIVSLPKPLQRPHPPILLGVDGPTAIDRVLDMDAEWLPWLAREGDGLADRIAELNERAEAAGRGPVPVTLAGASVDEEEIAYYTEIGVSRCLFALPALERDELLTLLDWYVEVIDGVQ